MSARYELLAGEKSHGVFPTREAAKGFAILRDRVLGVEVHWDDRIQDAVGHRSNGTGEWRVTPARTAAPGDCSPHRVG